jgi:iron-sulfur cluster insertion protein
VKIVFTDQAIDKLKVYELTGDRVIKLKYETEGCGCVMSGVPFLWIVDHKEEDELVIETNFGPVLVEKSKMVFFDDELKIDFVESANCFKLSSPNQIINPRMRLIEKSVVAHELKA